MFGDKFISIDMVDQRYKTTSKYMLSDLSVIPTMLPDLRNLPSEYELEVNVDSYFINTFIDGKGALPETDTFIVVAKNDEVNVVIGYSGQASNRVTIPVEVSEFKEIEPVSFNVQYVFKHIDNK